MNKQWNRAKYTSEEKLIRALRPFVEAYLKVAVEMHLGDVPNEHLMSVIISVGDGRRAYSTMKEVGAIKEQMLGDFHD